jgi:hypothetical protein
VSECRIDTDPSGAESVGHDLRERGLVALTLRARAGDQAHRPVVGDREPRVLAAPARDLHVARDADTEQPRIVAPATLGLLAPERVVVRQPEGLVERLLVGSRVVAGVRDGPVREPVDEVPPADPAVDAELGGEHVDRALDQRGRLRTPGAAVRPEGRLVREDAPDIDVDARDRVRADGHQRGGLRDRGPLVG